MAFTVLDFASEQLRMCTQVHICLPDAGTLRNKPDMADRKVLWLLHGLSDDSSAWMRYSRIENFATRNDIVVVMPYGARSMYCDDCMGQNFYSHIAEELPLYLHNLFGLSLDRDKNFIAGLSMGGMGAMKIALNNPDRYFAAGSFSGVLDFTDVALVDKDRLAAEFPFMLPLMDDPATSPLNPTALLDGEKHKDLKLYVSCGLQDHLVEASRAFLAKAEKEGLQVESCFEDGTHEWGFWNRHAERFINFALNN